MKHYILDKDGETLIEAGPLRYVDFMASKDRFTKTTLLGGDGNNPHVKVSTVFLGLDHNWIASSYPIVWETMIFGGPESIDERQWRYTSKAEALEGHEFAIQLVLKEFKKQDRKKKAIQKQEEILFDEKPFVRSIKL